MQLPVGAVACMCKKDMMFEVEEEVKLSLGRVVVFWAFFVFPSCFQESKFSSTSALFMSNVWGSLLES